MSDAVLQVIEGRSCLLVFVGGARTGKTGKTRTMIGSPDGRGDGDGDGDGGGRGYGSGGGSGDNGGVINADADSSNSLDRGGGVAVRACSALLERAEEMVESIDVDVSISVVAATPRGSQVDLLGPEANAGGGGGGGGQRPRARHKPPVEASVTSIDET